MSSLFFVVCIVAIACTAAVLMEYLKTRAKREDSSADAADYVAQIETLEKRIRVLERIVTDNKFDLRREIDKL